MDTNKKMPVNVFPPLEEGADPRSNLSFDSITGSITAEVELLADHTKPRALLKSSAAWAPTRIHMVNPSLALPSIDHSFLAFSLLLRSSGFVCVVTASVDPSRYIFHVHS